MQISLVGPFCPLHSPRVNDSFRYVKSSRFDDNLVTVIVLSHTLLSTCLTVPGVDYMRIEDAKSQ